LDALAVFKAFQVAPCGPWLVLLGKIALLKGCLNKQFEKMDAAAEAAQAYNSFLSGAPACNCWCGNSCMAWLFYKGCATTNIVALDKSLANLCLLVVKGMWGCALYGFSVFCQPFRGS
jgi:hypothetical protein